MKVSFGAMQLVVLSAFFAISVLLAAVFVIVARHDDDRVSFDRVKSTGYRIRSGWLIVLVVVLSAVLAATAFALPNYNGGAPPGRTVHVIAGQFYWVLDATDLHAGERVSFDVTSRDVNHGFGLYDPDGHLIGSVQAMPGYHNHLTVTLDRAGSYTIACLEFCGLDHHLMTRPLVVRG